MDFTEIGVPAYHTRVERWECDYNDHWNARFYGRSFQYAAETLAVRSGLVNPGADVIRERHVRFHRELRVSAPVEVRSATLAGGGALDGATVHLLLSGKELSATALDLPGAPGNLPRIAAEAVPMALPRALDGVVEAPPPSSLVTEAELGPIRSEHVDHLDKLRFEELMRCTAMIQHIHFNRVGLTPEFSQRTGINRMAAEFRVTRGASPPPGSILRGQTWLQRVQGKSLSSASRIMTSEGETVALIQTCVLTVNLDTRKAVDVPDFVHAAAGSTTLEENA